MRCQIQIATDDAVPFVKQSWLRSSTEPKHRVLAAEGVHPYIFGTMHDPLVCAVLERAPTFIATNPEDPLHFMAFLCAELQGDTLVLHYAYTKPVFRRLGLMCKLATHAVRELPHERIVVSHLTRRMVPWCAKRKALYVPHAMLGTCAIPEVRNVKYEMDSYLPNAGSKLPKHQLAESQSGTRNIGSDRHHSPRFDVNVALPTDGMDNALPGVQRQPNVRPGNPGRFQGR